MDNHRKAMNDILPEIYGELRRQAQAYLRRQPPGFTLRPTELVNEACVHLLARGTGGWQSPEHFRAVATRKIWQVIVDYLKRRYAQKRGGVPRRAPMDPDDAVNGEQRPEPWRRVPLENVTVEWHDHPVDFLDLADSLEQLGAEHARLKEVVTLHWFGGMTYSEVAGVLNVSASTIEKDFRYALAWLSRKLAN